MLHPATGIKRIQHFLQQDGSPALQVAQGKKSKIEFEIQIRYSKFKFLNQCLPFNLFQVDRNFSVPSRKFMKTDNDRVFVYTCINWFYSFTNYIETKLEEDCSITSFEKWIAKTTEVSPSIKTFTLTYWEKGFKPLLPTLCQRHFQDIYGGDLAANSFTESENAALKKDTMGPRPNQSIDRSHEAISKHERRQLARVRTTALQLLSQTACLTVVSELDSMKAVLSDLLVPEAVNDLLQQYEAANNYLFFQVSEETFYVKKLHWVQ
jgi:hypothetical protein